MLGRVQAPQRAAALDPAPTWPIFAAIGNPAPNYFWQAREFTEHLPKRPLSLYTAVAKWGIYV